MRSFVDVDSERTCARSERFWIDSAAASDAYDVWRTNRRAQTVDATRLTFAN